MVDLWRRELLKVRSDRVILGGPMGYPGNRAGRR